MSQFITKASVLKSGLSLLGVLGIFLFLYAGEAYSQETEPPSAPLDAAPVGAIPQAPVVLLDGAADVVDITRAFGPVDINDIAPEFATPPPTPLSTEAQKEDAEEVGEIKSLEELEQEAEIVAAPAPVWYGVYVKNTSDQPVERLLVISRDTFRGSAWAPAFGEGLEMQNIVIKTAQSGRVLGGGLGLNTDVLLMITMVIPPQETAKIALLLPKQLTASALYLWRVDSYVQYFKYVTFGQGIALGLLMLMGAILIALWIFAGPRAFAFSGLACLAAAFYLAQAFGYFSFPAKFFGFIHIYYAGAALALAGALANRTINSVLTFDLSDSFSKNMLKISYFLWIFAFLYCLAGLPWAVMTLRALLPISLVLMLFAMVRQMTNGAPGSRLSLPGWAVVLLAYVLGIVLVLSPGSELNLISEWLVYAFFVLGVMLVSFSVILEAGAGHVSSLAFSPSAPPEFSKEYHSDAPAGKAAMASVVHSAEYYDVGLKAAGEGLWDWNVPGDNLYLSPAISEILGVMDGAAATTEEEWRDRLHPYDQERYRKSLKSYLLLGSTTFSIHFRVRHEDGSYLNLKLTGTCAHDDQGQPLHCVGVIKPAVEEVERVAESPAAPVLDVLAALPRREAFLDEAERVLAAIAPGDVTQEEDDGSILAAIILLDIDRFKSFDAGLGQANADELLVIIVERLMSVMGSDDLLGRLGGDEFGFLMQRPGDLGIVENRASEVKRVVEQPLSLAGTDIYPTISIGIAFLGSQSKSATQLLGEAEKALYQAKRAGGRQMVTYAPGMGRDKGVTLNLESELRRALDQYEMEVYYQPVMDLHNGRIAGFEALLRWNHPSRGLLGPDQFVSMAEDLGLIVRLGRFALSMTSLQLSQWQQFFPLERPLFASVNISAKQLLGQELLSDVRQIMKTVALHPGSLKLEVTENLLIENAEEAAHILSELKALGVGIVLDDFGTGHSTMERLKTFPFDTLKIDQSFVSGLEDDEQLLIMVRSAIDLAHDLGIDVVAEGVETESVGRKLYDLGCAYAQGFVFGAPMTAMEAQAYIAHYWAD